MSQDAPVGITIPRRFTTAGADPFESIAFTRRRSAIFNTDGSVIFEMSDVEVPNEWTQVAVDILVSKYFRKAGVPQVGEDGETLRDENDEPVLGTETSARQWALRLSNAWRIWGERGGYFATSEDALAFRDELAYMLMTQMGSPNSPQHFNTGLFEAYGIVSDPEGNWYVDPETGETKESLHRYERSAVNACFISDVGDELVGPGSIFEFIQNEARLFKSGSGSGANFSKIRGKGERLSGGGTSSGVMSFLRVADRAAGAIKCLHESTLVQTRRGMVQISDVVSGDEVPTRDGWKPVVAVHANGVRPVVKLTTSLGDELVCTPEHRFWVRSTSGEECWKDAASILPTDHLLLDLSAPTMGELQPLAPTNPGHHNERFLELPEYLSESLALWLGMVVGDGNCTRGPLSQYFGMQIAEVDADLVSKYRALVEGLFPGVAVFESRRSDKSDASMSLRFCSTQLYRFLSENGLLKDLSSKWVIPEAVWKSPAPVRSAFLAGLFETDGFVSNGYAAFSTAHESLALGVQRLLVTIGIPSVRRVITDRSSAYGSAAMHEVRVVSSEGMVRFGKLVGFVSERKSVLLDAAVERKSESPFNSTWAFPAAEGEVGRFWELAQAGERRILAPYTRYASPRGVSLVTARKLIDAAPDLLAGSRIERFAAGEEMWVRAAVEDAGTAPVFDLTVDTSHEYLAQGLRTHNSGGTTRRAAKMVILDADHPEIEDFIWSKVREEEKVAALVAGGFSSDWNGEAYDTVSFQNGNNSVRLPADFMEKVRADAEWELTARTTGQAVKALSAKKLWDDIADAAWRCADPGVQFDDILNDWNTVPNDARLRGTNPCSEFTHIDDTACNLASLNLVKYFNDETQIFDFEMFKHAVRLFTVVLEISVYMSHYPAEKIAHNSHEHRPLGLGYANIGALLMRSGLPYDSPEGLAAMGAITALMHDTAYATSAELAAVVGPCAAWGRNVDPMSRVLRNHARAAYGTRIGESDLGPYEQLAVLPRGIDHDVLRSTPFANLSDAVIIAADEMLEGITGSGYRNAQTTVLAPTGTIGLQQDCDTTGIEPDFALVKFKKLAGGGYMKIVNNSVRPALKSLGYDPAAIDRILVHAVGTQSLEGPTAVNRGSLLAKGLPALAIDRVQAQLKAVTELSMAFSTYVVGVDVLEEMGLTAEQYTALEFNLLEHLGYSKTECASSSEVICGHGTVEGAADLEEKHLPVFDTANYCGDGTRVIAWEGHVRALGAVAPHLSGSASKTINLPNDATVEEIRSAYELSYDLGVKCAAVYRDGSKLSQVLSSQKAKEEDEELAQDLAEMTSIVTTTVLREIEDGESPTQYYHGTTPPKFKLPSERLSRTWKFTVGEQEVFLQAGQYDDGTLGEVWITLGNGKEGTLTSSILHCFAVSISMGLQYGVPLERFVKMFVWHNFQPAGIVTGHKNLKMATSIMDAIFKVLAFTYLGREDLVQVPDPKPRKAVLLPNGETEVPVQRSAAPAVPAALAGAASGKGLDLHPVTPGTTTDADPAAHSVDTRQEPGRTQTGSMFASGEACTNCGGQMVKSGTCSRCLNCGETSGCS